MAATEHRLGNPLQGRGRRDPIVRRNRIARRTVKEMRPVVDLLGPGLPGDLQIVFFDRILHHAEHSARSKHTEDLVIRNLDVIAIGIRLCMTTMFTRLSA